MDYSKFYPEWFTKGRKPTEKEINKMISIARNGAPSVPRTTVPYRLFPRMRPPMCSVLRR